MLVFLFSAAPATRPADDVLESVPAGKTFKLSEARGKFVALHFLLKTECPYCLRYTNEYASRAGELPELVNVFIKPDSAKAIAHWADGLDKGAPTIYRDPDAALAKSLKIPGGYKFHGEVVHYPALVLIGPDGVECFRYVGKSNADRMPFDALVKKIARLKSNSDKP
jgi:peroxiredoxin Q/BCP